MVERGKQDGRLSFNVETPSRSRSVAVPTGLRERPQWLNWRREVVLGRETKVPYRSDGRGRASSTDSDSWTDYDCALAMLEVGSFDGVGFVVTENDPIVGGDFDGCRISTSGEIHPTARKIIERFPTYWEVSPSGRGLRFFGLADLPADHPCRTGKIEVYSRGRYFTVTHDHLPSSPTELADISDGLHWLFATFFQPRRDPTGRPTNTREVRADHEIIERALQARNGDRFAKLWTGDWQAAGFSSHSEADLALCSHLTYWCNGDGAQVARLFEQSGLCRPKWLERHDYRTRTLARALAGVGHA